MHPHSHESYAKMFQALVRRMVFVSVLPILGMGAASFVTFYSLNRSIALDQHASSLRYHRESIEGFLNNVSAELSTLANQYTLQELRGGALERVFPIIQQKAGIYTDVGLIDSEGDQVTYLGPYDLAGKNYRDAEWFGQVVTRGVYVSDVFLGKRGVPHFIIAVKRQEGDTFWILRATVNTEYFSKLVDAGRVGQTGETFVVNSAGLNQSRTRFAGELLAPSGFPDLEPHDDVRVRELSIDGKTYLYTTTWLSRPRWLLIFRQEKYDVFEPLRRASAFGLAAMLLGTLGATTLAVMVARKQVRLIKDGDVEKQALTQRLLVTGKTAAVGEMSAGLAHEINNPLASIDALQTWIGDLARQAPVVEADRLEILDSAAKIGEQVHRCKIITQGLLKFCRKVDSKPVDMDLDELLQELATICRTRAKLENVSVETDLGGLPAIRGTPAHLQQIFVNLVNNAIDATVGRSDGAVIIRSRLDQGTVRVEILDNGSGIPSEELSKIFLPFYTTKPVGKGTGLGLAIVYGLVQEVGGAISVDSTPGKGTRFTVNLPASHQPAGPPVSRGAP